MPAKSKIKKSGEPMVWLTAMGLSVGLLMILGLLGLILVKGVEVFWPKRVLEVKIQAPNQEGEKIWGELVLTQTKKGTGEEKIQESQFFLGNKDALGQSFRYVPQNQIEGMSRPPDLMVLERLEYGDAIGLPLRLVLPDGKTITAENPEFRSTLKKSVQQANARWKSIKTIEKQQIGKINRQLDKLNLKEKKLAQQTPPPSGDLEKLDQTRKKLQAQYQTLASEARQLRDQQEEGHLFLKLANSQELSIPTGQILDFYYPNQLKFHDRVGLFLENIWNFLSKEPREANTEGGIFPALFGTLVMTVLMSLAVVPFGILGAIYLREYAKQGFMVRMVRVAVNNLAGVPSIVFGVFGLGFFVYLMGGTIDQLFFSDRLPTPTFGTGGILWASLTLALMTVPVVIVSTEEALAAVPRGIREGALACGASKWQTVKGILLPAAAPGILTGAILAMARGAGEVAPLMLVGVVKLAPSLPLDTNFPYIHLDQKFMHLGFHIFDLGFQSPDSEAAKPMVFATTLLLIALVLVLNLGAMVLRERLRKKYAAGTF